MMLFAVAVLLLGVSGNAMAYFTADGELIRAVYSGNGSGQEILTDLGPVSSLSSVQNFNTSNFSLAGLGGSATWANSYVGYFAVALSPTQQAWTSGPLTGQSNAGMQNFNNIYSAAGYVMGNASQSVGQSFTVSQSDPNSYHTQMNAGSAGAGYMGGYLFGGGDQNLAALGSTGYVDQVIYNYANPDDAAQGVGIAVIRTFADGHSESNPAVVPVPAPILLFGSGLIGLVGIGRRKQSA